MTIESKIVKFEQTLKGLRTERPDPIDWTAFTPVVTQLGNVTLGAGSFAYYWVFGNRVEVEIYIEVTGTGTTANAITVGGWPSAVDAGEVGRIVFGSAQIWDASGEYHVGNAIAAGASALGIQIDGTQSEWHTAGVFPDFPLGVNDRIAIRGSWRI